MTQYVNTLPFDKLPRTIPVFSLPGILLLPGGQLPLHLFEERYRDMTRDAIAGDRMIGVMQPRDPDNSEWSPELYSIGCLGRIVSFRESEDGRYYMTLAGICRYTTVREEKTNTLYRRMEVDYDNYEADMEENADAATLIDRETFIPTLKTFLTQFQVDVDWDALDQVDDGPLLRSLAMTCPFEPSEKQAILEAMTVAERAKLVTTLIEMAVAASDGGEDEDRRLQ